MVRGDGLGGVLIHNGGIGDGPYLFNQVGGDRRAEGEMLGRIGRHRARHMKRASWEQACAQEDRQDIGGGAQCHAHDEHAHTPWCRQRPHTSWWSNVVVGRRKRCGRTSTSRGCAALSMF